jgi:hypothetical protein
MVLVFGSLESLRTALFCACGGGSISKAAARTSGGSIIDMEERGLELGDSGGVLRGGV